LPPVAKEKIGTLLLASEMPVHTDADTDIDMDRYRYRGPALPIEQ